MASQGSLSVFWSNGLVGSITGLAIVLLFWPLISRFIAYLRSGRGRVEPQSTGSQ